MREILFRGKCIDDGGWAYGDYYSSNEMPQRGEVGYFIKCGLNEEYRIIPETRGEFTGLKDKDGKGKEMFEGDIFKDWQGKLSVIIWKYSGWAFEAINESSFKYREGFHNIGEVIGNKYDNPELLGGENINEK